MLVCWYQFMGIKVKSNLAVLMAQHDPPLKQVDVAREAGVSPTTINQLYNDSLQRLDRKLCSRLFKAFGWTPGDIWVVVETEDQQGDIDG
ncbi:helix-turn-helix transcriptional regulator [Okeania sp. SIO2G5]|uniref:helix-turn-helix domain-containing protein n=1 Tax=Okeania sp. SIO2G5 TaxID=2607796 RepID=UPI0013C195EB|nr:helix-turn-helix transcriptional regulator [Okeania sp. SIO2G5]NEP76337.1 helix-turn-helix transcriptional regulator [Okeania sp. SIO2G5]